MKKWKDVLESVWQIRDNELLCILISAPSHVTWKTVCIATQWKIGLLDLCLCCVTVELKSQEAIETLMRDSFWSENMTDTSVTKLSLQFHIQIGHNSHLLVYLIGHDVHFLLQWQTVILILFSTNWKICCVMQHVLLCFSAVCAVTERYCEGSIYCSVVKQWHLSKADKSELQFWLEKKVFIKPFHQGLYDRDITLISLSFTN